MRPKLRAAAFEVGDLEAGQLRDGLAFDDGVQRRRGDPSAHALLPPVAPHRKLDFLVDRCEGKPVAKSGAAFYRAAVETEHDVAAAQPGFFCRRIGLHVADDRARGRRCIEVRRGVGRQVFNIDVEAAAPYFAEARDLVDHLAHDIHRHRETDADVAARRTDDGGVDADQIAARRLLQDLDQIVEVVGP